MYSELIKTQEQAIAHLFIHCCYKNGKFSEAELDAVSGIFVMLGMQHELNFKDELQHYRSYINEIGNEEAYLQYLVSLVLPTNELALYSYCVELCVSDSLIDATEVTLLEHLGTVLSITEEDQALIQKLIVQRRLVFTQKYF